MSKLNLCRGRRRLEAHGLRTLQLADNGSKGTHQDLEADRQKTPSFLFMIMSSWVP